MYEINERSSGRKAGGSYRVVCGIRVLVEPPTPAQESVLAESLRSATRPAVPAPRIDATAGGRFQGFRVP